MSIPISRVERLSRACARAASSWHDGVRLPVYGGSPTPEDRGANSGARSEPEPPSASRTSRGDPRPGKPDCHRHAPSHVEPSRQRLRRSDLQLLAGEDRLEGRLEPAVRILQRDDTAGDDIVLLEHLLHRARLPARELSVDIGHQQPVAELGHDNSLAVC